nr:facilitated trehalose transporter Tret1-like isoform X1 [Leptinotarsa decemlineata]
MTFEFAFKIKCVDFSEIRQWCEHDRGRNVFQLKKLFLETSRWILRNMNSRLETKTRNELPEWRQAVPQVIAVSIKNTLLLSFGMTLGFPTILIPALSGDDASETIKLGTEAISWIGSINLICAPLGCLMSGSLTHLLGRRMTMQLVNIPILTAWFLFYFSTDVWHIFLASCITGLSGGLLEAPVLTYVAEVTQPRLRGMLSSTSTTSIVLGIFGQFLLGSFLSWRVLAVVNCAFPIASLILLMIIPETPVWLITKKRLEEAKKSLAWLRGWTSVENIEDEFQVLYKEITIDGDDGKELLSNKLLNMKLFGKLNFIWPYSLITLAFVLCHFNGNSALQVYAIKVFKTFKTPLSEYYCTAIMGLAQLLGCIVCITFIKFLGKRVINFISTAATGICFIIVGTYAYMNNIEYLENPANDTSSADNSTYFHQWIPVTFLVFSTFFSFCGVKILPWVLIGELFCNEIRASAAGLSAAVGYIISFFASKLFLDMVATMTLPGMFWFSGGIGVIGTIVLYFVLPETEGKSLFEITEHFAGRNKLTNSVRKSKPSGRCNPAFEIEEQNFTDIRF